MARKFDDRRGRFRERSAREHLEAPTLEELEAYGMVPAPSAKRPRRRRADASPRERADVGQRRLGTFIEQLMGAGYRAEFRSAELYVDGKRIGSRLGDVLVAKQALPRELRRDDVFARLIERHLPDLLLLQVRDRVRAFDEDLFLRRAAKGPEIEIVRCGQVVARVSASAFNTAKGQHRKGRFWAPGPHWSDALSLIAAASASRPVIPRMRGSQRAAEPSRRSAERRRGPRAAPPPASKTENWPPDADVSLTRRASQASQLLRDHRVRGDEFKIQLDCPDGETISFEPARPSRTSARFDLPFRFESAAGTVEGGIHLASPNVPLSIYLVPCDSDVDLPRAWALMLEAAADRYCSDGDGSGETGESPLFRPQGRTTEFLKEHQVISHRVRLQHGRRASDDAIKAAEACGINLPDGYTWRRAHRRGGSVLDGEEVVLRYSWRPRALSIDPVSS